MKEQSGAESRSEIDSDASGNAIELATKAGDVSDQDFETVVRGALDAVGGVLMFKLRIEEPDAPHYAAAAYVGEGESRQFLILILPVAGGHLRVETVAGSKSPIAGIVAAYAGLAEALTHAA